MSIQGHPTLHCIDKPFVESPFLSLSDNLNSHQGVTVPDLERNKQNVVAFYDLMFNPAPTSCHLIMSLSISR